MSLMDQQSIITQVAREDCECEQSKSANTTERVTVTRKPKSSRLLESLLCCFRPASATVVHQTPPPPPPHLSSLPTSPTTLTTSTTASAGCTEDNGFSVPLEVVVDDLPFLLQPLKADLVCDKPRKCAVIDLDETLVHSSFAPVGNADFVIPVEIDGTIHQVYVLKRPHVDEFLQKMGELFECILFTASLGKYADPVADLLDKWGVFQARLFRDSCVFHHGSYVKDLSRLGRELNQVVIIDNSPMSYMFHPQNAVPVLSWFDDMSDCELLNLIPFFEALADIDDIYTFLGTADQLHDQAVTTSDPPSPHIDYHLPNHIGTVTSTITSPLPPPPNTTGQLSDHASNPSPLANANYQLPNHTRMIASLSSPTTGDRLPDDVSATTDLASPGPGDDLSNHVCTMDSQLPLTSDDCGQIEDTNEASMMTSDVVAQEE